MSKPSSTVKGRENQLVSLAVELAEKKLRDGTASTPIIVHFLKLGTTVAELEKEKLEHENAFLRAKTNAVEAQSKDEDFYNRVIAALTSYGAISHADEDF